MFSSAKTIWIYFRWSNVFIQKGRRTLARFLGLLGVNYIQYIIPSADNLIIISDAISVAVGPGTELLGLGTIDDLPGAVHDDVIKW